MVYNKSIQPIYSDCKIFTFYKENGTTVVPTPAPDTGINKIL